MPQNPYNSEYGRTAAMLMNYDGDLDDLVLDSDSFDGSEEDVLAHSDEVFHTFDNEEIDPISAAVAEPMDLDFGEATEELNEGGLENAFDASVDAKLDRAVARLSPQRINDIAMESTFDIPQVDKPVKSLSEYVKTIQESFDKYIDEKIAQYSK